MYTTPPNIKKSLSDFMADLDAKAVSSEEARDDVAWLAEAFTYIREGFDDIEVSPAFIPLRRSTDKVQHDGTETHLEQRANNRPQEMDRKAHTLSAASDSDNAHDALVSAPESTPSFDEVDYTATWPETESEAQETDEPYFASEQSQQREDAPIPFASLGGALDDDFEITPLDVVAARKGNTGTLMVIAATLLVFVGSAAFFAQNIQNASRSVFSDAAVVIDDTARSRWVIVPATARTVSE